MRLRPVVLPALTLIVLFAVSAAMASDDACQLLTQQQVSAAVGVPMGAGTHTTATYVKTCTWSPSAANKDVSAVTISFQQAQSYDGAKSMAQMMVANAKTDPKAKAASLDPAPGVGDDAFFTTMGEGYTAMLVKKGNVSFKVAIYGQMPADKKKAAEKALALQALSKV